ncbi:MAG: hypothetical protein QOF76_4838, partial [Solirubrobacteraceae bacterium]|nr:hypothetical protein [Solirubrobacteraceae bacterium]
PGALVLLASLALAATAAAPAQAGPPAPQGPTFGLSAVGTASAPVLHGRPGDALRGAVLVRNLTRHPVSVRLQPADIRNATSGSADFITTKLSATGRWLHLATTTARLPPRATRRVAYTVSVPANSPVASYYAGIVAVDAAELAPTSTASPKKTKHPSFSFDRINRQALPVTVRLPGPRSHRLALHSLTLRVQPAGAGLVLGLLPGGTDLIPETRVDLRVQRGPRTVFTHHATLGQLFPGDPLDYRVAWSGRPTAGDYRVVGVIRPLGAPAIYIDQRVAYTPATAKALERETVPGPTLPGLPLWVWLVLGAGAALLLFLVFAVWRLKRRPAAQPA